MRKCLSLLLLLAVLVVISFMVVLRLPNNAVRVAKDSVVFSGVGLHIHLGQFNPFLEPSQRRDCCSLNVSLYLDGQFNSSLDPSQRRGCCNLSVSLTVEMIFEMSGRCSKNVTLESVQCTCENLILCKLLVVSAISDDHLNEAVDFIASVQAHMPKSPILMYNLGLSEKNKKKLSTFCNVRIKEFNFDKYPKHVRQLQTYAWKPLIINEVYAEEKGKVALWGDASCRVKRPVTSLFPRFSRFPIIPGVTDGHRFISTTHTGMMKYLHLNRTRKEYASIGNSLQANIIMFYFNQTLHEHFLKYWVDCALHVECIAPKNASLWHCNNWKGMDIGEYACHRFDQAAYNAILTREFGFNFMKEMAGNGTAAYFIVERFPTKRYKVLTQNGCHT